MKKLFTIDDFMVAFISALGYGFGEAISRLFGWSEAICIVASLALGIGVEETVSKIAFSEAVQKKPINRVVTYASFFMIFLIAQYISIRLMGVSMIDYFMEQILYVVGLPVLGFILNMFIRGYRVRKIRKLYGDGNDGYVFDVKVKDIEEINQKNQPIHGTYKKEYAVKTKTGIFVGEKQKKLVYYLGIPYAKPPVGELRWKAPEPLPASDDVFEARNFGASAIQVEHKGSVIKHHRQSEDCLTLNVCVDTQSASSKPVLVLFHHGDFSYGGTVDPLLYGTHIVEKHPDVVFVSFNYRLGIFGYIDFSEVPGGENYPDALNLGLLDQIEALKWIKENIAAFGGDPDRITVAGFESGATSISLLAATEKAKGLFHKAFVFNGDPGMAYDTPEAARTLAKSLLNETNAATMEELMRLDTETLKAAAQKLWLNMCAPTCDGTWIPSDVYRAYEYGAASGIEFVIGIPSNEREVFRSTFGNQNYEALVSGSVDSLQNYVDRSVIEAVQEYIEAEKATTSELEAKSKLIEQWNALCIYRSSKNLSRGGNKVHLLYWNKKPLIEKLGSGTIDAAAALLGNDEALQMYGSVMDRDVSEILQMLLLKFMNGEALRLYPNEIKGVAGIDWDVFPKALIISDEKLHCDTIETDLTEVKGLLEFFKS